MPTRIPGLSIVPSSLDLSGAELELINEKRRNYRLRDALAEYAAEGNPASYVLIDCPPSLNLLTVNAMVAADAVMVPLQCEFFALEGLTQLLKTIDLVRANLNPILELQGIVLTMYDKPQQPVRPGCGRRARPSWRKGLSDDHPAQRAHFGSAEPRHCRR